MTTILTNGKIYVEKGKFVEALLIEDGVIKEIGSKEEILKNKADHVIDLEGKTVLPGFNDSHLHLTDRPGVVGRIGTTLGRIGVNIASMQVSRRVAGGEALMAITVDSPVPADLLHEAAREIGAAAASAVDLRDE